MKKLTFIFLILLLAQNGFAITNDAWLRKVSIQLTGASADQDDMDYIRTLSKPEASEFIIKKIKDYQKTHQYNEKMRHRLDELFRLRVNYHGEKGKFDVFDTNANGNALEGRFSSLDQLFVKIFKKNLSWDQLLLEKEYEAYSLAPYSPNQGSDAISDLTFYSYIFQEQLRGAKEKFDEIRDNRVADEETGEQENFDPNDERLKNKVAALTQAEKDAVAGALTTSRFFTRYPTTKLNKNRKRAAAVFRVFLCDSMTPVILSSKEEDLKLLNLALNKQELSVVSDSKRHGDDPTCSSCHYKLEPAAKTFNGSSQILNKQTSAGALVYKREDGTMVNVPVNGLGQLGKAITEQPEYLQCQVNHFWNWFVGQDIPLSPEKKLYLAQKFDELERKPNDFIQYLLTSEDYTAPELLSESKVNYSHVKPLLKRCDSCHAEAPLAPVLSGGYPFSTDKGMNEFAVGMIHLSTSLDEDGKGYMPPRDAGWKLQGKDRDLLKAWIRNGAKDKEGKVMLGKKAIELYKNNTKLSQPIKPELTATFEDTHKRYYENYDFILSLRKLFGDNVNYNCEEVYQRNSQRVGFLITNNGKPLAKYASTAYIEYIQKCLHSTLLNSINSVKNKREALNYVSSELADKISIKSTSLLSVFSNDEKISFNSAWSSLLIDIKWTELSNDLKLKQVEALYDRYIGETVYSEQQREALIRKAISIADKIVLSKGEDSLLEALIWTSFTLLVSEEFLTF